MSLDSIGTEDAEGGIEEEDGGWGGWHEVSNGIKAKRAAKGQNKGGEEEDWAGDGSEWDEGADGQGGKRSVSDFSVAPPLIR